MSRMWLGTALLSASWLLGLGYLDPPQHLAWGVCLLLAVSMLTRAPFPIPESRVTWLAIAMLLLPAWVMPLPFKAIPILLTAGALLCVAPIPRDGPVAWGRAAIVASLILLLQAVAIQAYESLTARAHELPQFLATCVGLIPKLLGIEAAFDGTVLAMRSQQQTFRIAVTWELLLDLATFCFLAGGVLPLFLTTRADAKGKRLYLELLRRWLQFVAIVVAWLPFRVALLLAIVLHRALRADATTAPNVGSVFVQAWLQILLLAGPVVFAARFVRPSLARNHGGADVAAPQPALPMQWRPAWGVGFVVLGSAVLAALFLWIPVGRPGSGRIMVVERHSTWEPTTEPYGTKVYGESGSYNYGAAYAYCQQFFEMSRLLEPEPITLTTLRRADVLVIKTPTARYAEDEVRAVVRFVEEGGSLLLIGDHTNVFNMNTHLNDIARHFGFTFRNDLLFHVSAPYKQPYRPSCVPHPAIQRVETMSFAVSCSIDPGTSQGDMVIRSHGLWSLPPAYHETNYHPQAEYRTDMQYGAWCQLWSTYHGRGRVLGFADSTLFSNFCLFQPGKAALLVGMFQWLNHHGEWDDPARRRWLAACGSVGASLLLLLGMWWGQRWGGLLIAAAGLAGWSAASLAIITVHQRALPPVQAKQQMPHVVIDRTLSEVPLFLGAFTEGDEGTGYGMLEQWIPRLGNYTSRGTEEAVFSGDGLVIICPTRSVTAAYQARLRRFVSGGGHVLVLDSPDVEGSTANSLLWPFGLASDHRTAQPSDGRLRCAFPVHEVPLPASCKIAGGKPLAWVGDVPVGARVRYGKGMITAIGFAALFNDASMGYHWLPEPEAEVRARYEILYAILEASLLTRSWWQTAEGVR